MGATRGTNATSDGGGSVYLNAPPPFDDDDKVDPTSYLVVACAVGLLTGLGVAAFNIAEHHVHDLVFLGGSPGRFDLEGPREVRWKTPRRTACGGGRPARLVFVFARVRP